MPNKDKVPDAWDDDWEAQADGGAPLEEPAQEPVALTRTERLARHEEAQRKLWEAAYVMFLYQFENRRAIPS